jgi:hypothetical protein
VKVDKKSKKRYILPRAGEPGIFGSLKPEPLENKTGVEPEPLGKKVRSREKLKN